MPPPQCPYALVTGLLLGVASLTSAQDPRFLEIPRLQFVEPIAVAPEPAPPPAPAPQDYPLFTRQNVARDTPDILFEAFQNPTKENVEKWYEWMLRRQQVSSRVQQLLREIDQERKGRQP